MIDTRILLVDDSDAVLYAIQECLKPTGARVLTAKDGAEGQRIIACNPIDLVITDIDMPKLDGLELCRWIKMHPDTAGTPVIILSSRESDADIDAGFKVGADAYVPKSSAVKDLIPRLEAVLDKTKVVKDRGILLVDDSEAVRTALGTGLVDAGFEVWLARDGKEALDMLDDIVPDLILTDLLMPEIDGKQLCREVRKRKSLSEVPIVVMSCVSDKGVMQRMLQEGASAFLTKPFGVNNLLQVLEKIFSEQFHLMLKEQERLRSERNLTLASITSLVKALEARDRYTVGHSESVTRISLGIARRLGLADGELSRLHLAGILHDLGKIGVRDSVLLKPGKLTDKEYEHIKTHTTVVADILDPLPGMDDVLIAASSHHERWDGSGYPKGLSGNDIPLFGRIIAVADVYDAMTSDRVYRLALPQMFAREIIVKGRSKLFCPTCVDAFKKWFSDSGGQPVTEELWAV